MNQLQYFPTLLDKPDQQNASKEAFTIFYAWIVAFFIMEPLTSLLIFKDKKQPTFLTLITDFAYASVPLLKSMYLYKHFTKDSFFPHRLEDLPLFISFYVSLQMILDGLFLFTLSRTGTIKYPLRSLLMKYDGVTKMSHSVSVTTYGIIWIYLTFLVYTKLKPIDTISIIIASLFLMLLLEYPQKQFTK
jgi:hypothetical protein